MSPGLDWFHRAYDLVPRAFQGGLLAAAGCGAIGVFLRWRRLVWTGFAVPEAATVGTAFSLGAPTLLPVLGLGVALPAFLLDKDVSSLIAAALAVLWLVPVARSARPGGERAAAACFLLATTLAIFLLAEDPHGAEEFRQFATGKTLLWLPDSDVALLAWTMPPLVLLALLFARPMAALAFDRDHARASGHPVRRLEAGFAVVFLALVALVVPRVGGIFAFAYLTLAPAAAERIVARPVRTVFVSILLADLGLLAGATAGALLDLPFATASAGGIVAVAAVASLVGAVARLAAAGLRRTA